MGGIWDIHKGPPYLALMTQPWPLLSSLLTCIPVCGAPWPGPTTSFLQRQALLSTECEEEQGEVGWGQSQGQGPVPSYCFGIPFLTCPSVLVSMTLPLPAPSPPKAPNHSLAHMSLQSPKSTDPRAHTQSPHSLYAASNSWGQRAGTENKVLALYVILLSLIPGRSPLSPPRVISGQSQE